MTALGCVFMVVLMLGLVAAPFGVGAQPTGKVYQRTGGPKQYDAAVRPWKAFLDIPAR